MTADLDRLGRDALALGVTMVALVAGVALGSIVYFLPWLIANGRKHHNRGAIFLTNLLLGWTVIGWCVALIWAGTAVEKK